jgi:hypothetical protein
MFSVEFWFGYAMVEPAKPLSKGWQFRAYPDRPAEIQATKKEGISEWAYRQKPRL